MFVTGGFFSDTEGYVNDSCKMCPNGTFVPYDIAPGTSARDCKACPQGKCCQKINNTSTGTLNILTVIVKSVFL